MNLLTRAHLKRSRSQRKTLLDPAREIGPESVHVPKRRPHLFIDHSRAVSIGRIPSFEAIERGRASVVISDHSAQPWVPALVANLDTVHPIDCLLNVGHPADELGVDHHIGHELDRGLDASGDRQNPLSFAGEGGRVIAAIELEQSDSAFFLFARPISTSGHDRTAATIRARRPHAIPTHWPFTEAVGHLRFGVRDAGEQPAFSNTLSGGRVSNLRRPALPLLGGERRGRASNGIGRLGNRCARGVAENQ